MSGSAETRPIQSLYGLQNWEELLGRPLKPTERRTLRRPGGEVLFIARVVAACHPARLTPNRQPKQLEDYPRPLGAHQYYHIDITRSAFSGLVGMYYVEVVWYGLACAVLSAVRIVPENDVLGFGPGRSPRDEPITSGLRMQVLGEVVRQQIATTVVQAAWLRKIVAGKAFAAGSLEDLTSLYHEHGEIIVTRITPTRCFVNFCGLAGLDRFEAIWRQDGLRVVISELTTARVPLSVNDRAMGRPRPEDLPQSLDLNDPFYRAVGTLCELVIAQYLKRR